MMKKARGVKRRVLGRFPRRRTRFMRIQREWSRRKHGDAEVSRDPLWSRKLAYSLLHFLQRLSSPRFHARQLKSLINMQRETGKKKRVGMKGRERRRYSRKSDEGRWMKKEVPRKECWTDGWKSCSGSTASRSAKTCATLLGLKTTNIDIHFTFTAIRTWFN